MGKKHNNGARLNTWKEIAEYLDCGVRTCRRWEVELDLPVYRVKGSEKSRVYAHKDEIDRWLSTRANNLNHDRTTTRLISRNKILFFAVPIISVCAMFALFLVRATAKTQPFDFQITNSLLKILNENGKELWEFDTNKEKLKNEEHYRKHFQIKTLSDSEPSNPRFPLLKFIDINHDGSIEVLFSVITEGAYGSDKLYCFKENGERLWTFTAGKRIEFGNTIFADFLIHGFDVSDSDRDGNFEIIVISFAVQRFPTQLCILNCKGDKLGEYWNSGQFTDYAFADLNEDGKEELIVSGLNNEYTKGVLIAFDVDNIDGYSPQFSTKYICKDNRLGSQLYYILFPRTDVDRAISELEAIKQIGILSNPGFYLRATHSSLLYEMDFKLNLVNIIRSSSFKKRHKSLKSAGKIFSQIDDEYIDNLKQQMLYFNGTEWVSKPSLSNPWPDSSK